MHEQGVRSRCAHHFAVHTPVGKRLFARFVLGLIAHAGPHIRGDQVGTGAGLHRILKDLITFSGADAGNRLVHLVAARCAQMDLETQNFARLQPGVGHVVAVAHPGNRLAPDRAAVLDVGEDVRQDLARVKFIGQAVDDRHARVRCKTGYLGLLESADHHQIDHAADDLGTVFDRLGAAQLTITRCQVYHAAAELVHAGFKTHAGAGRGLFENHGHGAVDQRLVFFVCLEFFLDECGALEQVVILVSIQVTELEVVLDIFCSHA